MVFYVLRDPFAEWYDQLEDRYTAVIGNADSSEDIRRTAVQKRDFLRSQYKWAKEMERDFPGRPEARNSMEAVLGEADRVVGLLEQGITDVDVKYEGRR